MPPENQTPTRPETLVVRAAVGTDSAYGAVIPPLYTSTTYTFPALGEVPEFDYGRSGNPTRNHLADALARLEHGAGAVITSSGMAALDMVLNLVPVGGLVVAPHDLYGGSHRLLLAREKQGRFRVRFLDLTRPDAPARLRKAAPALLLIETPSNPLMRISDVRALSAAVHHGGGRVVCDNTFLSPVRQNPLRLGADLVVHSTTKFINGHSDVIGGAVIARDAAVMEELAWWANCTGVTGAPFDAAQTLRGLRTLCVRMDRQEDNAKRLAAFLRSDERVRHVYYPDGEQALAQASGPGAMLSFELSGGLEAARSFFARPVLFQFAESLGGTESLICHPASMTHRAMDAAAQTKAGITPGLVRLSVGLEHIQDQLAALETMLGQIVQGETV